MLQTSITMFFDIEKNRRILYPKHLNSFIYLNKTGIFSVFCLPAKVDFNFLALKSGLPVNLNSVKLY